MSIVNSLLSFRPVDGSYSEDDDLMEILSDMARKIPNKAPEFVRIAPGDTGAGLLEAFYQRAYVSFPPVEKPTLNRN
jgi:hypothetical protein